MWTVNISKHSDLLNILQMFCDCKQNYINYVFQGACTDFLPLFFQIKLKCPEPFPVKAVFIYQVRELSRVYFIRK